MLQKLKDIKKPQVWKAKRLGATSADLRYAATNCHLNLHADLVEFRKEYNEHIPLPNEQQFLNKISVLDFYLVVTKLNNMN